MEKDEIQINATESVTEFNKIVTEEFSFPSELNVKQFVLVTLLALLAVVGLIVIVLLTLKLTFYYKHRHEKTSISDSETASDDASDDVEILPENYPSIWKNSIERISHQSLLPPPSRPSSAYSGNRLSSRMSFLIPEDVNGYLISVSPSSIGLTEFPRNFLYIRKLLGEGQFGYVLKAQYRPPPNGFDSRAMKVAVKCPKVCGNVNKADLYKQFIAEAEKMKSLNHPNILSVIGLSSSNPGGGCRRVSGSSPRGNLHEILQVIDEAPLAVLPYIRKGDLKNYLSNLRRENRHISIPLKTLLKFAHDISNGMAYLVGKGVLHRDLAARNCLLNDNGSVLVSDFGLAKHLYYNHLYYRPADANTMMPIKWMALESLEDRIFTEKSDVWSFGVTVWEILSFCIIPYPGLSGCEVPGYLRSGARLSKPVISTHDVWKVVTACWREYPKDRPKFSNLKSEFYTLYKKYSSMKRMSKQMISEMVPEPPPRPKSLHNLTTIGASTDNWRMHRQSDGNKSLYAPTSGLSFSTMELFSPIV